MRDGNSVQERCVALKMKTLCNIAVCCAWLALSCAGACLAQTATSGSAPLPNPGELLQRAIANESRLAAEQERYACRVNDETTELDSKGQVKKVETETKEQF